MSEENKPIALYQPTDAERGDTFADPLAFGHWQRVANMIAQSELLPQHLRGRLPDVLIGLDVARRLHLNPISVLQNLYVVKGTPGWKTTFLLALAAAAGWDIDWEVETLTPARVKWKRRTKDGQVDAEGDNLRVRCILKKPHIALTKTGMWVSTAQAIAAKWADNEQYAHSTELMLRYRAAAFAIRLYDPNLLLGLPTAEEAREDRDVINASEVEQPKVERGVAGLREKLIRHAGEPRSAESLRAEAQGAAEWDGSVINGNSTSSHVSTDDEADRSVSAKDLEVRRAAAAATGGTPSPHPVDDRPGIYAEIGTLEALLPEAVKDRVRGKYQISRLGPKRDRPTLVAMLADYRAAAVEHGVKAPPLGGPAIDPRESLIGRILDLRDELGLDLYRELGGVVDLSVLGALADDKLVALRDQLEKALAELDASTEQQAGEP